MLLIEIENYKTIKKLSMEFEGYATLLGKNFVGKSAVVGALDAALTNKAGTSFIRWGEKFCNVRIVHTSRGKVFDILWHKEEKNNFYVINGEKMEKIARGIPEELTNAGYGLLTVGEEKINLNYAPQFSPLFLVDRVQSQFVTDLLSSIYKIDVLYKANDLLKKDLKKDRSLLKVRVADKNGAEQRLKRFEPFLTVKAEADALQEQKDSLLQQESTLGDLKTVLGAFEESVATTRKLKDVRTVPTPDIRELEEGLVGIHILHGLLSESDTLRQGVSGLKGIEKVPSLEKALYDIESFAKTLEGLHRLLDEARDSKAAVASLRTVGEIVAPAAPEQDLENLASLHGLLDELLGSKRACKSLECLPSSEGLPEALADAEAMLKRMEAGRTLLAEVVTAKKEANQAKSDMEALDVVLKELLEKKESMETGLGEFKNCPTCGSPLPHEHGGSL